MKKFKFILKIILIALICFLCKHLIQAIIEFTDIIPVRPKAYIWGKIGRAQYVFMWQFVFTFWVYILSVILFYFMLKINLIKKIKSWKIASLISFLVFLFLLYAHQGSFPYIKGPGINPRSLNYAIFEEWIIYTLVGFLLIYLLRKWLVKNSSYLQPPNLNKP